MPFLAPIGAAIAGGLGAGAAGATAAGALTSGIGSSLLGAVKGAQGFQQTPGQQAQLQGLQLQQDAASQYGSNIDANSISAQNDFAAQLQQAQQQGLNPTAADINAQQGLASQLFQARQVGLQQDFLKQQQNFEQTAARLGRSPLDPVFRNKLAEQQLQAQERLGAEQNAFGTQLAMQQPYQRLQLGQQRVGVLQGLASQALANRQALASLGGQAAQVQQQGQGGGFLGAFQGATSLFGPGLTAGQQAVKGLFR